LPQSASFAHTRRVIPPAALGMVRMLSGFMLPISAIHRRAVKNLPAASQAKSLAQDHKIWL
jgi:hypothetical protein